MAEITKITTPMIPKENLAIKLKPVTDQAFELTDPSKVHKPDNEGKATDRQADTTTLLKDSMGRPAIVPLLKNPNDLVQTFKKIAFLIEMGVSASDAAKDVSTRELLESLFVSPKEVADIVAQQDKSSVLFKGEAFDILRDIMAKFSGNPKIKDAVVDLLKTFDQNVNAQNSVKTILNNCNNLLDYMFSRDRSQFSGYIKELAEMLLPKNEAEAFIGKMADSQPAQQTNQTQEYGQAQNNNQTGYIAQAESGHPQVSTQGGLPEQAQNIAGQESQNSEAAQNAQIPQDPQNPEATQNAQVPQNPQNPEAAQNAQVPQSPQNPEAAQNANAQQTQQAQQAVTQEGTTPQAQIPNGGTGGILQTPEQQAQPPQESYDPVNQGLSTQKFGQELHQKANQVSYQTNMDGQLPQLSQKEAAQVLKNNLLPLLGEVVVKYHQNEHIRDVVMVVVHNIVRIDQGTPEALKEAVNKLVNELKNVANMPKGFENQFLEAVNQNAHNAKNTPDTVMSKISDIISGALRSPDTNPAVLRQAENMLISMLQNQSSMMDILHFVVPFQTPQGQVFTELYVDPETDEKVGRQKGQSHKIFLSVESESHGSFELCFLETNDHVDFSMWVPDDLVQSLSGLKRNFANVMQLHGYTMNSYNVDKMKAPHTVAEVFPRLIEKKVGIDVNA